MARIVHGPREDSSVSPADFSLHQNDVHPPERMHHSVEMNEISSSTPASQQTPTMDVGGATFDTTRTISSTQLEPTTSATATTENNDNDDGRSILLVAKGKSHLSYFYVPVCSSVLYLAPDDANAANNDAILFQQQEDDDNDNTDTNNTNALPMALEIYYHMPSRRADFQWATNTFIEKNLTGNDNNDNGNDNGQQATISDLPTNMQQSLSQFNNLFENVKVGDRYLLQYIPGCGMSLSLNNDHLGTVGGNLSMRDQKELARLIYSVWFGERSPFSESMKKELLTPLDPPVEIIIPTRLLLSNEDGSNAPQKSALERDVNVFDKEEKTLWDSIDSIFAKNRLTENRKENANILATSSSNGNDVNKSSSNTMTEEETKLFKSMGLLQYLEEDSGGANSQSQVPASATPTHRPSQSTNAKARVRQNDQVSVSQNSSAPSANVAQPLGTWTRIRNLLLRPKIAATTSYQMENNTATNNIHTAIITPVSPESSTLAIDTDTLNTNEKGGHKMNNAIADPDSEYKYNPILLGLGGAAFLLPHLAVLLSLPPVLMKRGAPYLPTFGNKLDTMFDAIKNHALHSKYLKQKSSNKSLKFVDLGSGDGRVVFRAAREGIFETSVGYEINPTLDLFAKCRKLVTPKYWNGRTRFYIRDLWKVRLQEYDVVAVYGLAPIMERLGKKLEEELRPGSIVVSNVFEIPGWRVSTRSSGDGDGDEKKIVEGGKGVFLYRVPECFGGKSRDSD